MPNSKPIKKPKKTNYSYAVGRRKTATARIRLYNSPTVVGLAGISQIVVNDQPVEAYFPGELAKRAYTQPFILTDTLKKMSVSARIQGSGKSGQLDALVHGIARALATLDVAKFRGPL